MAPMEKMEAGGLRNVVESLKPEGADLLGSKRPVLLSDTIQPELHALETLSADRKALLSSIVWKYNPENDLEFGSLLKVFAEFVGNTQEAARMLGVTASSYYRWMSEVRNSPRKIVRVGIKSAMLDIMNRPLNSPKAIKQVPNGGAGRRRRSG